jgi:hypothetical protein
MAGEVLSDEQVNVTGDEPVSRLILNAVATFVKDEDFHAKFASHGPVAKVELFVNGHRVPVVESLADAWRRCDEELEQKARKMALKMVSEAGLEPIAAVLREAEHAIRTKLECWDYE